MWHFVPNFLWTYIFFLPRFENILHAYFSAMYIIAFALKFLHIRERKKNIRDRVPRKAKQNKCLKFTNIHTFGRSARTCWRLSSATKVSLRACRSRALAEGTKKAVRSSNVSFLKNRSRGSLIHAFLCKLFSSYIEVIVLVCVSFPHECLRH